MESQYSSKHINGSVYAAFDNRWCRNYAENWNQSLLYAENLKYNEFWNELNGFYMKYNNSMSWMLHQVDAYQFVHDFVESQSEFMLKHWRWNLTDLNEGDNNVRFNKSMTKGAHRHNLWKRALDISGAHIAPGWPCTTLKALLKNPFQNYKVGEDTQYELSTVQDDFWVYLSRYRLGYYCRGAIQHKLQADPTQE